MTSTELMKIINLARKNGILKLKFKGIEIEFSPDAMFPGKTKDGPIPEVLEIQKEMFTEEQIAEAASLGLTPEAAKTVLWSSSTDGAA